MTFLFIQICTVACMSSLFRDVESRRGLIPYEFMGEHMPICGEASCKGRCGSQQEYYCSCDTLCMTFRDCCYDYGQHCTRYAKPAPEVPEYNTDQGFSNLLTWTSEIQPIVDQLTCVKYPNPDDLYKYFDLLTEATCPGNTTETNLTHNCLTMSNDLRVNTPLLYEANMLIYKNLACLECNVINVDMKKVVYAEPNYRCENVTVFRHAMDLISNGRGSRAYDVLTEEDCLLRYQFQQSIFPVLGKSLTTHYLDCGLIQYCNRSNFNGTTAGFLNAQHYCNLYLSPIESYKRAIYRNAHCAYCNGLSMDDIKTCKANIDLMPSFDFLPSMTLLLNVRDDDISTPNLKVGGVPVCKTGLFLDVISKQCIKACAGGLVFVGGVCIKSHDVITAPNLTVPEFSFNQDFVFRLKTNSSTSDLNILTLELINNFTDFVLIKEIVDNCELKYPWLDTPYSNFTCIRVKLSNMWYRPFPSANVQDYTLLPNTDMSGIMNTMKDTPAVEVFAIQVDLFSNESISCHKNHMQAHIDYGIIFSNCEMKDSLAGNCIIKHGKIFENTLNRRELPVGYLAKYNFESQSFESPKHFAIFCKATIVSCMTKKMTIDTARILNGSLHDNNTGDTYEEGTYVHLTGQQYIVCVNESKDTPVKSNNNKIDNSVEATVQGILTLLFNIISPSFLFFTILTYFLLKPLRTLPGIGILNLSISLLFAQIIFQVGHSLRPWPLLCYVMAIVQHYFWLVTFMWMNVLAYLSYKTFTKSTIGQQVKVTKIIPLLIYAWGIPMVFLAVCIVIEWYQWLPFQYGNESSCWINGNEGRLYLFATPLAVIIAINLILFICTTLAIRQTMQVADTATSTHKENRNRFIIYIKLSTVMGFTWLFGFLANLKILSFFWYFFIILNGLQGVFICVSFVMNGRVLKLYQDILNTKRELSSSKQTNITPVESTSTGKATQSSPELSK